MAGGTLVPRIPPPPARELSSHARGRCEQCSRCRGGSELSSRGREGAPERKRAAPGASDPRVRSEGVACARGRVGASEPGGASEAGRGSRGGSGLQRRVRSWRWVGSPEACRRGRVGSGHAQAVCARLSDYAGCRPALCRRRPQRVHDAEAWGGAGSARVSAVPAFREQGGHSGRRCFRGGHAPCRRVAVECKEAAAEQAPRTAGAANVAVRCGVSESVPDCLAPRPAPGWSGIARCGAARRSERGHQAGQLRRTDPPLHAQVTWAQLCGLSDMRESGEIGDDRSLCDAGESAAWELRRGLRAR